MGSVESTVVYKHYMKCVSSYHPWPAGV